MKLCSKWIAINSLHKMHKSDDNHMNRNEISRKNSFKNREIERKIKLKIHCTSIELKTSKSCANTQSEHWTPIDFRYIFFLFRFLSLLHQKKKNFYSFYYYFLVVFYRFFEHIFTSLYGNSYCNCCCCCWIFFLQVYSFVSWESLGSLSHSNIQIRFNPNIL